MGLEQRERVQGVGDKVREEREGGGQMKQGFH